ncbi:DNA helicase-4 [Pseudomonas sp. PvP009]|nr:DNA helicase-4 [Pseudomonas sp. PvP009]
MFTVTARNSPLLAELAKYGVVMVAGIKGHPIQEERCSACQYGFVLQRTCKFGDFKFCSGFPRCKYNPDKPKHQGTRQPKLTRRLY